MNKIVLKYKRGRIILSAVLMFFWIFVSIVYTYDMIYNDNFRIFSYGWLALGIFYTANYSFTIYKQYVTIKGNWLYRNELPFKKINLEKLIEVKKFAGDYTLRTDEKEMLINTQIMDDSSRKTFESIIDQNFPKKD